MLDWLTRRIECSLGHQHEVLRHNAVGKAWWCCTMCGNQKRAPMEDRLPR